MRRRARSERLQVAHRADRVRADDFEHERHHGGIELAILEETDRTRGGLLGCCEMGFCDCHQLNRLVPTVALREGGPLGRQLGRSVATNGVKCGHVVPVWDHKTRGQHSAPRLFSPRTCVTSSGAPTLGRRDRLPWLECPEPQERHYSLFDQPWYHQDPILALHKQPKPTSATRPPTATGNSLLLLNPKQKAVRPRMIRPMPSSLSSFHFLLVFSMTTTSRRACEVCATG